MRLTRRGVAVLVAAIVLFGVGQWAGYPVFLAVAAAAVGAVIAAVAATARPPRVAVAREVYPDRVERGRPAVARLRVRNPGARRQPGFVAGDVVGDGFRSVAVRPLAPGAEAVYHYELPTGSRGRHQVGPLTLDRADALGLGRRRLSTGDTTTLWVHPRTHAVNAIASGLLRHHHEGQASESSPRGSLDVREVREYVAGDEVRHLHWKATARTGRLMVRDYADPNQPRFTALLDDRPEALTPPAFEEAVDLAASLSVAAAKADHRCRLVTCGGADIATSGGTTAIRRLLDELCLLERAGDAGLALVPPALSKGGGGTLVVITGAGADRDRTALGAMRQRYPDQIVIVLGAADRNSRNVVVPGAKVLYAATAADAARRWNTVIAA